MHVCRPIHAISTNLLRVGFVCGLAFDLLGIHTISLPPGIELPPTRHTTPWRHMKWSVAKITLAKLMTLLTARSKRLPQPCSATKSESRTAKPVASRISRIFGPASRCRIAQILPQMCLASRASRPRVTVGFVRNLCNGLCTAQRFHVEGEEIV